MSVVRAKKNAKRRGPRRRSKVVRRRGQNKSNSDYSYICENDRKTHVLVPIDEFDRLRHLADVQQLVAKLEDPNEEWVDAEQFAWQLAGNRIATARKARGLTQKQLGEKLELPQSQISRIERNPDSTSIRMLKRIARALRVNVSSLVA